MIPELLVYNKDGFPRGKHGMLMSCTATVQHERGSVDYTFAPDGQFTLVDYYNRDVMLARWDVRHHPCILKLDPDVDLFAHCVSYLTDYTMPVQKTRITFTVRWYPRLEHMLRRWVARFRENKIKRHAIQLIESAVIHWMYRPGGRLSIKTMAHFDAAALSVM